VKELNLKAKNLKDLLTGEPFTKDDIIVLQDPKDVESKQLANFHYIQQGLKVDEEVNTDPTKNINVDSTTKRILEKVQKQNEEKDAQNSTNSTNSTSETKEQKAAKRAQQLRAEAPGFTSSAFSAVQMTAVDPRTKQIKTDKKGYVRLVTNLGAINIELHCDMVPKTCENFLLLAERGFYDNTIFHRCIKNFMIQGGDPTGTGRGGESAWGKDKPLFDEFHHKLSHSGGGIVSMANKGPNTGSSQFFITFKSCTHLDRKHSIFGRVVGGGEVLKALERVDVDDDDRPKTPIKLLQVIVYTNPLSDESQKQAQIEQEAKTAKAKADEDARYDMSNRGTWFSNPAPKMAGSESSTVGKYLKTGASGKKRGLEVEAQDKSKTAKVAKSTQKLNDFSSW